MLGRLEFQKKKKQKRIGRLSTIRINPMTSSYAIKSSKNYSTEKVSVFFIRIIFN